ELLPSGAAALSAEPTGWDLHSDLDLAIRAARAAGREVMRHFRGGGEVRYKEPGQPVTEADLAADRVLREMLLRERPGYGWLSEETADSPERLERTRVWVVDPIDGTHSFVDGKPEFAVSVGLAVDGLPLLGVVFNPARDELYHAHRGGGAFLNGEPVRVGGVREGVRPVAVASGFEFEHGAFAPFRDEWEIRLLGSTTLKMVAVADGTADVYLSPGTKKEWDVCAADLIVREAGGQVTDLAGAEIRYNRPEPYVAGALVTGGLPHDATLARVPAGCRE
ncbi:MAG TPA: 3'(2'),5'-bisphosphate nucleotidase CysQ, partial [Longimicrobiaceae bacterium]|nr:3'(2'),5'-bisphosphate nucleotidase CysQ [Longimicrobiaceae bacterium]